MQRYRVNYVLLISLIVGFFVSGGAAYGLWRYQVDKNAKILLAKADAAEASGNIQEAYESLVQYIRLRPSETDNRARLGELAVKVLDEEDVELEILQNAFLTISESVRLTDDPELRRKLVDVQTRFRQFDLALVNINELLDQGSDDAKLKSLKAQCLFALQKPVEAANWSYGLVGYDQKTNEFDPSKAQASDQPIVYAMLSNYLNQSKQPELAKQMIDQMIAANAESHEAYLYQYQFLKGLPDNEGARTALEKAFELAPTDADVLSSKGAEEIAEFQTAMAEATGADAEEEREAAKQHIDKAAEFFEEALERYPDRIDFYDRAARIEMFREKPDAALAVVAKGIAKFPLKEKVNRLGVPLAINLSTIKVETLIGQKEFAAVDEEIKALRALKNAQVDALAEFHEARLAAVNEKWAEAAAKLQAVKPRLLGFPDQQALAGAIQGFCHTQLGQFDLALEAYKWALEKNPYLPQAIAGRDEMQQKVNPHAENIDDSAVALDGMIKEMMARPRAEQNWDTVSEKIDAYIDEQAKARPVPAKWAESRKALLRGQTFAMRAVGETDAALQKQLFEDARNAIKAAYAVAPEDATVQMAAIRLLAQEPGSGPSKALALLDNIVKKGEDTAAFRTLRIDLLFALRDEQLPKQLNAATQGMESWPDNQQSLVWSTVGARFEQLGQVDEARRCLEQAAALAPNGLPTRIALFDLALKQNDDPGMRNAQEKILEIVKNKTDPDYILSEVKRRIVGLGSGAATREELVEARAMLDAAIQARPAWADLRVAKGQLALALDNNNVDEALAEFDAALELGASNLNAIALQVRLLAERGQLQEARKRLDRIPPQAWSAVLDRTAADVLLGVGETDKAFTEAEKVAQAKPGDSPTQAWFAEIASRANKPEAAEAAMKKAIELNPEDPDLWTRQVSYYLQAKRPAEVERTLREAHLALDDEFLPLLTAKYNELQSRWQEAEDIYLMAYADRLNDVNVARRLAEFYLTWSEKSEANRGKAAIYLNRILHAANEGKLAENDPNGPWARRQAARLLSTTGDYQDSMKAERMLMSAAKNGVLAAEDRDQLIDLLNLRNDPASRQQAIGLLRTTRQERGGLPVERELLLADLLYRLNDWTAAKAQMEDAIGRYPNDIRLQTALASMLIGRKEFDPARFWISRLSSNQELAASLSELRLRLAAAEGNKEDVRKVLTEMTPDLRLLSEQQLQLVRSVALLADSVGDHEYALTLLQEYARRAPGSELELAKLTALYGNLDEGLAMLKLQMDGKMDDALRVAMEVLRSRRSEAPEKLDEEVGRIVRAGLRDDPESAHRMVLEAEMLELQTKFEESIAAYQQLLARDDVPKLVRATALNNLAFLLALHSQKPEDLQLALKSVNEAIETIGPISDILDTRALAHLALQQYAEAAADMKLSVLINPTPSKFFHLAMAHLGAGDEAAALAAWEEAKAHGIAPESVSKLEQDRLQEFIKKMEAVSATAQL